MRHLIVCICLLAAAQTRVHGPSQVRDLAGGGSLAWYHAAIEFGAIGAGQCAERFLPAPGLSPGMAVAAGWPATLPAQTHGMMYAVSDGAVVRLCAMQPTAVPALTYSVVAMAWR